MKRNKTVAEFFDNLTNWQTELLTIRSILLETGMEETIKWGAPAYMYQGKNVAGISTFKSYFGIWFFQGGLLKDSQQKLVNAQENKTKAMRQWRFDSIEEIDSDLIKAYINESIENFKAGKEIKPERGKPVIIPDELKVAFLKDKELEHEFKALNLGKRREFAKHIGSAKRQETRDARLAKCIPMIKAGIGVHDKYKNC